MKTIIAGSRRGVSRGDVEVAMRHCRWHVTEVVSGGARGVDKHGEEWAREHKIPVYRMPADWNKHGRSAGPIRNRQMALYADALIAIWDGNSQGTEDMIEQARKQRLDVIVYCTDTRIAYEYVPSQDLPGFGARRIPERTR